MRLKILIISAFILLIQACEFNVSTANISDVKVCTKVNDASCDGDQSSIASTVGEVFTTAKLNNALDGAVVTISWEYDNEGAWYVIDKVVLNYESGKNQLSSSLSAPTNGWPKGSYRVVYLLNTDNSEPIIKEFSIQ